MIALAGCQSLAVKPGTVGASIHLKSANASVASSDGTWEAPSTRPNAALRKPALFTGVATYTDPRGRYTFRYPSDWIAVTNASGDGVAFVPNAGDPNTVLISHATEIPHAVGSRDLAILGRQVDAELGRLPNAVIREPNDEAVGEALRLERVVSFRDGAATRERKVRVLIAGSWQLELIWQGATVDDYDYYLPQANYALTWFTLAPSLWSAFDGTPSASATFLSDSQAPETGRP
jgi:hypothetical protein